MKWEAVTYLASVLVAIFLTYAVVSYLGHRCQVSYGQTAYYDYLSRTCIVDGFARPVKF